MTELLYQEYYEIALLKGKLSSVVCTIGDEWKTSRTRVACLWSHSCRTLHCAVEGCVNNADVTNTDARVVLIFLRAGYTV